MFTDGDIFITNVTSTYEDIPKYCNLVGAEFDQDYPASTTRLNITDDGTFWIGATIGFKRNINPCLGLLRFISPKTLNYLAFQSFNFEHT
jgi:hypothetical protein